MEKEGVKLADYFYANCPCGFVEPMLVRLADLMLPKEHKCRYLKDMLDGLKGAGIVYWRKFKRDHKLPG
jgi:hypothetical protein